MCQRTSGGCARGPQMLKLVKALILFSMVLTVSACKDSLSEDEARKLIEEKGLGRTFFFGVGPEIGFISSSGNDARQKANKDFGAALVEYITDPQRRYVHSDFLKTDYERILKRYEPEIGMFARGSSQLHVYDNQMLPLEALHDSGLVTDFTPVVRGRWETIQIVPKPLSSNGVLIEDRGRIGYVFNVDLDHFQIGEIIGMHEANGKTEVLFTVVRVPNPRVAAFQSALSEFGWEPTSNAKIVSTSAFELGQNRITVSQFGNTWVID